MLETELDSCGQAEVLRDAYAELARQELRVDSKADQLLRLVTSLGTLAIAGVTLGGFHGASDWLLVLAGVSGGCWLTSVAVLMLRTVRPRLKNSPRGTFLSSTPVTDLRGLSPSEYLEQRIINLGRMVRARYRSVRLASDLLLLGFLPLLVAALVTVGARL